MQEKLFHWCWAHGLFPAGMGKSQKREDLEVPLLNEMCVALQCGCSKKCLAGSLDIGTLCLKGLIFKESLIRPLFLHIPALLSLQDAKWEARF